MPPAERYRREKEALARHGTSPYKERVSRGERLGLTASQAAGKPRRGEESASDFLAAPAWTTTFYAADPPRTVTITSDRRTAQRVGRYMRLTRDLREERITPDEFRQRVRRRAPIAGLRLLDDPRAVIGLAETTDRDDLIFESGRSRPRRSRRAA